MHFRFKVQYLLVRMFLRSNKEVAAWIAQGRVRINDTVISENTDVDDSDAIFVDDELVRKGIAYAYLLFHKPAGIECSMNPSIAGSLQSVLQLPGGFYHVGRLDKDSEGLLLLSNDGRLGKTLLDKHKGIKKVYEVEVDKPVDEAFLSFLANGVLVKGKLTLPCTTKKIGTHSFEITLVEGMNRQIRRMCYKAGYTVKRLVRTSFAGIRLDIPLRQTRELSTAEITHLRSL
jgi:23S rRNA pseudouridine2604 synthase